MTEQSNNKQHNNWLIIMVREMRFIVVANLNRHRMKSTELFSSITKTKTGLFSIYI